MKNVSVNMQLPCVFIEKNDIHLLVPSMVLSTIAACALITFIPQLMPLWMNAVSRSWT